MKLREINITKKQFDKIKKWGIIAILIIFTISKTTGYFKEQGSIKDITLLNLEENNENTIESNIENTENLSTDNTNIESSADNDNKSINYSEDNNDSTISSVNDETESDVVQAINNSKININTATSEELQELYRIGPAMAQKIIDYRTQYGDFTCIEEILEVSGIGEATYTKIKDYITVD